VPAPKNERGKEKFRKKPFPAFLLSLFEFPSVAGRAKQESPCPQPVLKAGERSDARRKDGLRTRTAGSLLVFEKHQQLIHRHAPSFIRDVLDRFRQRTLTADQATDQLGISPIGTPRLRMERPPDSRVGLCRHPDGHHSVRAAQPDPQQKPVLLFTNRPKCTFLFC
jgi:hypothetical protein